MDRFNLILPYFWHCQICKSYSIHGTLCTLYTYTCTCIIATSMKDGCWVIESKLISKRRRRHYRSQIKQILICDAIRLPFLFLSFSPILSLNQLDELNMNHSAMNKFSCRFNKYSIVTALSYAMNFSSFIHVLGSLCYFPVPNNNEEKKIWQLR